MGQTPERNFSDHLQTGIRDFSSFSNSGSEVSSSFRVSAQIIDSSTTIELLENTEFFSSDGTSQKIGLSIFPPRLLFENGMKTAEITLTNIGERNTAYRISLVNTLVDETGLRTPAKLWMMPEYARNGGLFAKKMLKFSPRWIRLRPSEQQKIRVATILPVKLEDGEYRSELLFSWAIDNEKLTDSDLSYELQEGAAASTNDDTVSEQLKKGLFVPLIIRKGELNASASFVEPHVESSESSTKLNLKISRKGNRSLYGDLLIFGFDKKNEKTGILHKISNVAIYPPTPQIKLSIELTEALTKESTKIDSLMIEYKAKGNEGNDVIASLTIKLLNGARASVE